MKLNIAKLKIEKIEPWIFGLLILVNLVPIVFNTYFLTGDGPCHIYNAKVLLDYWTGHNQDFYEPYYDINTNFEPNYLSSYLLAFFLSVLPDYLAEKALLILYVLTFAFSLRWLLGKINPANKVFALAGMPFIYQKPIQMGFFNYSISIALMFLIIAYWLHYRTKFTPLRQLIFCSLGVFMYFTHAGGLTLTIIILGALWVTDLIVKMFNEKDRIKQNMSIWKNEAFNLILCFLPAVLLQLAYVFRKSLSPTAGTESFPDLKERILNLSALVNLSAKEEIFATWMVYFFLFLIIGGVFTKIYSKKISSYDIFFILSVISIYVYFNLPNSIAGGSILSIRFQCIPFLFLLFWFASLNWHNAFRWILVAVCMILGIGFIVVRQPVHRLASDMAIEYSSVRYHIPDRSTVLPLSFAHNGRFPSGELVSDKIWLFMHAADYIGSDKSLVLLANYEANTGYFPFHWVWDRNPYRHLPVEGRGFEDQPPNADILGYSEKSWVGTIDYVITWCLDDSIKEDEGTKNILNQLNEGYDHIFSSENGLAQLYKRKAIPVEQAKE